MTYFKELLANWRPLLASTIGLSTGFTALAVTNSIMGPHLIRAFGWSKSEFALLGTLGLIALIALPLSGRLADRYGVRRTALVGVVTGPITFVVLSRMSGNFAFYLGIVIIQNLLCMTTTTAVFTRTVVQHIRKARGVALALVATGPAITIALAGPWLNNFVASHGWRNGYLALALFMGIGGLIAIALVPPRDDLARTATTQRHKSENVYAILARMPVFWIMLTGIVTTNVAQFIINSQLGVLLQANGVSAHAISPIISVLAIGILIGRFVCGFALDRFPTGIVATITLGMPAIGQFMIASSFDSTQVLTGAVLLLGMSYGAEADLIGYMVARNFGVRVYGTVLGIMAASISGGSAIGSLVLSATLKATGGYGLFLTMSGALTLGGSLLFLLLPRRAPQDDHIDDGSVARA
jgi:MFS family permease